MTEIYFLQIRDVKLPTRGTPESAGIDFYVPEYNEQFLKDLKDKNPILDYLYADSDRDSDIPILMVLKPGDRVLIPSGIKCAMGSDRALIAHNKSGVASKRGLDVLANVVDADYKGEIHINLVNTGSENVYIEFGEKIIQFIEIPIFISSIVQISNQENLDKYYRTNTRGSGGFGHTGTK